MRLPNYDGYTIPYVNLSCALGGVSVCVCLAKVQNGKKVRKVLAMTLTRFEGQTHISVIRCKVIICDDKDI